jgi:hypothetical protein
VKSFAVKYATGQSEERTEQDHNLIVEFARDERRPVKVACFTFSIFLVPIHQLDEFRSPGLKHEQMV